MKTQVRDVLQEFRSMVFQTPNFLNACAPPSCIKHLGRDAIEIGLPEMSSFSFLGKATQVYNNEIIMLRLRVAFLECTSTIIESS